MEGAEWTVHNTNIAVSSTWDVNVFATIESASVWLYDPIAASANPHMISLYIENRSVVYIGGADLRRLESHGNRLTLMSCNFNPGACVFLTSNVHVSVRGALPVQLLSCRIPIQTDQSCETKILLVPFDADESIQITSSSIIRANLLASASMFVSAGDKVYFTVFYWLSGSISATSMAPLPFEASQFKAAFLCGRYSCVLSANGHIYVQNGSSFIKKSMAAVRAANEAFAIDPRCKLPHERSAAAADLAVESAWIGDQELVIHWGAGCFSAVEWCESAFVDWFLREVSCFAAGRTVRTAHHDIESSLSTLTFHAGRIHAMSASALLHLGQLVSALTSSDRPRSLPYQLPFTPWSSPWLPVKP